MTEKMPHNLQASRYVVMIWSMAILNTVVDVLIPALWRHSERLGVRRIIVFHRGGICLRFELIMATSGCGSAVPSLRPRLYITSSSVSSTLYYTHTFAAHFSIFFFFFTFFPRSRLNKLAIAHLVLVHVSDLHRASRLSARSTTRITDNVSTWVHGVLRGIQIGFLRSNDRLT